MAKSTAARRRQAKAQPRYKTGPKKGKFKPGKPRASRKRKRNPPARRKRSTAVARRKKNPPRKRSTAKRTTKRRTTTRRRNPGRYARNPSLKRTTDMIVSTSIDAVQVVVGKAASVSVPDLLKLPSTGNTGIAVRAAAAVALGWIGDEFLGGDIGHNLLLGGLVGAVEDVAIKYNAPWLAPALQRSGTMGRHAGSPSGMRRYVRRMPQTVGNGGRLGRYARQ